MSDDAQRTPAPEEDGAAQPVDPPEEDGPAQPVAPPEEEGPIMCNWNRCKNRGSRRHGYCRIHRSAEKHKKIVEMQCKAHTCPGHEYIGKSICIPEEFAIVVGGEEERQKINSMIINNRFIKTMYGRQGWPCSANFCPEIGEENGIDVFPIHTGIDVSGFCDYCGGIVTARARTSWSGEIV